MINKPCPFCGGEPFFMDNDGWYWVRCRKCGVETPGSDIKEIAENQWKIEALQQVLQIRIRENGHEYIRFIK